MIESDLFSDPTKVPEQLSPTYIEIDKKREVSSFGNVVQFLKDEEIGDPTDQYILKN